MAGVFIRLMKQMVIFLIAGQTLLHFGMGKQYERYVKLVISLMLAAQLLSAAISLFPTGKRLWEWGSGKGMREVVEEGWEMNMEEFENKLYRKQEEFEDWQKNKQQQADKEEKAAQSRQIKVEEIRIQ